MLARRNVHATNGGRFFRVVHSGELAVEQDFPARQVGVAQQQRSSIGGRKADDDTSRRVLFPLYLRLRIVRKFGARQCAGQRIDRDAAFAGIERSGRRDCVRRTASS